MKEDPVVQRLKLRELRILLAVTKAGSMAKAATQLAISQPAVSRAIADMETTLGVALLNRHQQGVEPTPYGRALIKRSVTVFDELRQGVKEIEFMTAPTSGEIRVGGTPSIAVGIVAAVIDRLSRKYPSLSFHVVTDAIPALIRELRDRNVDMIIALTFEPVMEGDIDSEILNEDQMVVVAAATNPWTRRRRIELADLANENWTLPEPEHRWASAVVEAFRANGVEPPRAIVTTTSAHLRHTLLATGRFLTVVQKSLLQFPARPSFLKVLPVDLPTMRGTTRIMTLKNRTLSPASEFFIESAREVAKLLMKKSSKNYSVSVEHERRKAGLA